MSELPHVYANPKPLPTLEQIKMKVCIERLKFYSGNKSLAAKSLGIGRSTFYSWIDYWETFHK